MSCLDEKTTCRHIADFVLCRSRIFGGTWESHWEFRTDLVLGWFLHRGILILDIDYGGVGWLS